MVVAYWTCTGAGDLVGFKCPECQEFRHMVGQHHELFPSATGFDSGQNH